ncbi:hypothetical protein Tco_0487873 [Tanacetum coccineum]
MSYVLDLPKELSRVHHTFHVSNLKKCHVDEPLVVSLDGLHIDDKLHFIEENIEIMNREVKRLKPSCIPNCQVVVTYEVIWSLVKEKFNSTEPTDDKEREIWVELKRLFEPDTDDELWKLQKHIHDLTWKLYILVEIASVPTEEGNKTTYMLVKRVSALSRELLQ